MYTRARRRVPRLNASQFHAYSKTVCYTISAVAVALGPATDSAYPAAVVRVHNEGTRAARAGVHVERAVAHRPGNEHRCANPNSAPGVAEEIVRRIHCSLSNILADMSVADTVGNEVGGAVVDAVRLHDVELQHRILVVETSSAHRRRGARDWSRGTHSWRGWPTPAHSPIRLPPSTRRVIPAADNTVTETVVSDADRWCS